MTSSAPMMSKGMAVEEEEERLGQTLGATPTTIVVWRGRCTCGIHGEPGVLFLGQPFRYMRSGITGLGARQRRLLHL
jgi:hypothetical protein